MTVIFGSAFDLFWPERYKDWVVRLGFKICSVGVTMLTLASAPTMTVSWRRDMHAWVRRIKGIMTNQVIVTT